MSARVARVRGYLELAKCRAPFEAVCRNETREGQWPAIATKCSCFRALCGLLRCAERRARNRADSPPIEEEEGRGCTPTLPAIGAIGLRAPTVAGTRGVALELVAIAGDSRGSGGSMRVSTARVVELAVANAGLGELDGPGCAPRIQAKQAIAVRCGVDLGTGADTIGAMSARTVVIENGDPVALNAFLDEQIHAFNVSATGIDDAMPLYGTFEENGEVVAAISGHTWGGCCDIVQLWVHEDWRGRGLGAALLLAAEAEARRRGCTQVTLSSHSFQAPAFYEKFGYVRAAEITDYPKGHAKLIYAKRL